MHLTNKNCFFWRPLTLLRKAALLPPVDGLSQTLLKAYQLLVAKPLDGPPVVCLRVLYVTLPLRLVIGLDRAISGDLL